MKAKHILFAIFGVVLAFSILSGDPDLTTGTAMAGVAGLAVGDVLLKQTKALPNGAASITSDSIDLGHGANGSNVAEHEFVLEAPLLATADLPDTETMIYDIVTSDSSDLSSPTTAIDNVVTQTGASSAGAAAVTQRFRLPSDCKRYVGFKATNSGAGDASDKSATLAMKF